VQYLNPTDPGGGAGQAIHLKNTEEENRSFSVIEFLPFSLE
jgi:hypothetical protein